jgi:AcrR family transcriptional regulator
VSQTQQERKAETRARLLAAAADLFADQGIDAVSVDAVAEAAGRTSGAVYAHFGSKQGLLLALLDSWKDSALAVLMAEVAVSESPHEQLAAVWDNVAERSEGASGRWHLLEHELWLRATRDPAVAAVLRTRRAEAQRFSARHLREWTAAVGARPSIDPADLAVLVRALLLGLAMERALEPRVVTDELAVSGLSVLLGLDEPARAAPRRGPRAAGALGSSGPSPNGRTRNQRMSPKTNRTVRTQQEPTDRSTAP